MTVTEKMVNDGRTVCIVDDVNGTRYILEGNYACLERIGEVLNVTQAQGYAVPHVRYAP